MLKRILIVAPHGDDEIIGCYEIIKKCNEKGIQVLVSYCGEEQQHKENNPLQIVTARQVFLQKDMLYLFPDPIYETHPKHRKLGHDGESLLRIGYNVAFYSVNMQAPYIREVSNPASKKEMLDLYYPEKASLWEQDYKYFLFEGQCMWLTKEGKIWQDLF